METEAAENTHLREWVTELHWTAQADVAEALREPDEPATPLPLVMLTLWFRRVCCNIRGFSPYFYVAGIPTQTKTPRPDEVLRGLDVLQGSSAYPSTVRNALRVISMHADAPADRATALRYLQPLIAWMDERNRQVGRQVVD